MYRSTLQACHAGRGSCRSIPCHTSQPRHIKTPHGYQIQDDHCIQAVGNLYGYPPAGQNFSKDFDKCLRECGYENTPWDLKLFYKCTNGKSIIVIAHSDDFR